MDRIDLSVSVSKFLLPFYYENGKKTPPTPFDEADFTRYEVRTKYLAQSVYELFVDSPEAECKCYYLNDICWNKYGLPARFTKVTITSEMTGCSGSFDIIPTAIRLFYFKTGIGFLELEIQYPSDDVDVIADVGFCLSNIFTNEHDSGNQTNRLIFTYQSDKHFESFSLKNAFFNILNAESHKDSLKLFPSSTRKRLMVYHSVITSRQEDVNRKIYALCSGLHSNVFYDESMDDNVVFSSISDQLWGISSTGVASIAFTTAENNAFVEKTFKRNTTYDYFFVFLLVSHEREILLRYNHVAVINRSAPKALMAMKEALLRLRVLYTYNTISTESSYQRFYESIARKFNIASLEADIRDVVDAVDSHITAHNDRKVNSFLSAISLLAIFSALTDGIGLADRIQTGDAFGIMQWGIVIIIAVFVIIAVYYSRKKR